MTETVDRQAEDHPVGVADGAPDPRRWQALWIIAVAQLMVVLDASIVNIAMPHAQADLDISTANRQWMVTAYTLAFGGLLLLGGRIADYLGRKRAFVWGLIGFALASALGGLAPNAALLFAARALQGAFAALLAPAALSLITVAFTESRERAKAFGVYGAISGGGAAIGLIVGGVLTEYTSWRWCLLVNVPIALVAAFFALPVVRESRAQGEARYDLPGAVTVTAGLVALVYGFTVAAEDGWSDARTLGLLIGSVVLLAAFVAIEARSAAPLLPLRVAWERNRGGSFLASLLIGAGLFAMFLFLTYYFQSTLGYSALKTGFAFLPFSVGIIISAGAASQLLPRVGPGVLAGVGTAMAAVGMGLLMAIGVDSSYVSHVLPSELLISFGMGFSFVPLSNLALVGVAAHDAGVASALVNTTQQIGGSLGTALLNTVYATAVGSYLDSHGRGPQALAQSQIEGYTTAFLWGAILIAIAAVVIFVFIRAGREAAVNVEGAPAHVG